MTHHEPNLAEIQKEYHGTLHSYAIGFIASFALTIAAFALVYFKMVKTPYVIVLLALVQAMFQLRYFLKLGYETHPRWESLTFYFMVLVLIIIAAGSLWIMHDLDARLMPEM